MQLFLAGAGLLLLSFVAQLVLWRVALPKRHTRALLLLFAVVPVLVFAIAAASGHAVVFSAPELVRLALFYVACSLAYIVLYSAIENQSPTLAMVSHLAAAGSAGCTGRELFERFGRDETMRARLAVMERGGWLRRDGEALALTPQGRFYAKLFEYGGNVVGLGDLKGG